MKNEAMLLLEFLDNHDIDIFDKKYVVDNKFSDVY